MCNCMKEIEDRVKEKYSLKLPGINSVGFANKSIILEGTVQGTVLAQPIHVEYMVIGKFGRQRTRTKTLNMIPSYCPFCGEKLKKEEAT